MICAGAVEWPFHVGISTPDIDGSMAAIGAALGLRWVALDRPPVLHDTPRGPVRPSSRVVYSSEGPLHVELLQAEPGTVYPPERGTHLHHVGYWVDDLRQAIGEAEGTGWSLEVTMFDEAGLPSAFAYLSRPGSTWIELVDVANRPALRALLQGTDQANDSD